MKQIYNEGRVVGLSAWELYIRQFIADHPDIDPPTVSEWLASSTGSGNSMVLKLSAGTSAGYHDYVLPEGSALCAASVIHGSLFTGSADIDENGWAVRITDYGDLIVNNSEVSPESPGMVVPAGINSTMTDAEFSEWFSEHRTAYLEYTKIFDGICYQPGEWSTSGHDNVAKDLAPNIKERGVVRIRLSRALEADIFILLTGFLDKVILSGQCGMDGSLDTPSPYNGDFLGPAIYPWATKIIFQMANDSGRLFGSIDYTREFAGTSGQVDSHSVIDLMSKDPATYYGSHYTEAAVPLNVESFNVTESQGAAILALKEITNDGHEFPPALYVAKVTEAGDQSMYPIDVSAPGTVKVFTNEEDAKAYSTINNTYGLYIDESNHIHIYEQGQSGISISSSIKVSESSPYIATITSGDDIIQAISLTKNTEADDEGNPKYPLNLKGTDGVESHEQLNWEVLLNALGNNKSIQLLPQALKLFNDNHLEVFQNGSTVDSRIRDNYINIGGKRLYLADSAPSGDIPVGSIGIGW